MSEPILNRSFLDACSSGLDCLIRQLCEENPKVSGELIEFALFRILKGRDEKALKRSF